MIIHRLTNAIKRQDWFQVTVEIFIVIIGIFLGLQVQAWYDGKLAQEEEARLIAYFITDIEKNNKILEARNLFMENQVLKGFRVLEVLEKKQPLAQDKADFEEGVSLMSRTQGLDDYLNSLNQANVGKILNVEIRQILDRYLGYIKRSKGIATNIKTTMLSVMTYVRGNSGILNASGRKYVTEYDFDALKDDSQYKASVISAVHGMAQFQNRLNGVRVNSQKLVEILKQYQSGEEIVEVEFESVPLLPQNN